MISLKHLYHVNSSIIAIYVSPFPFPVFYRGDETGRLSCHHRPTIPLLLLQMLKAQKAGWLTDWKARATAWLGWMEKEEAATALQLTAAVY